MSKDQTQVWFAGHDCGRFFIKGCPVGKRTEKQVQIKSCPESGYRERLSIESCIWSRKQALEEYLATLRDDREALSRKADIVTEKIFEVLTEIETGPQAQIVHP